MSSWGVWVTVLLLGAALAGALALWLPRWRRHKAAAAARRPSFHSSKFATHTLTPRAYSPENVGNDASARPWERELASGGVSQVLPDAFDASQFLSTVKQQFLRLQTAWDMADTQAMSQLMSADMLAQVQARLAEQPPGQAPRQTEVAMLRAELLGLDSRTSTWVADVEFSGMLTEDASSGPNPFREVWSFVRAAAADDAWRVVDVEALQ